MRALLLALWIGLPLAGWTGTFEVTASVDRHELELGESLRLTLSLSVQGQLDFAPQLEQPRFDGFEARGPQQLQSMQWVNGSVSVNQSLVWELTAVKAGRLTLGPFVVSGKDARLGDIVKKTQALTVTVRRPKNLAFKALATPGPGEEGWQAPQRDEEQLRDIKPDRPFPWLRVGLWVGGSLAALALLLTWWRRRPPVPLGPPPPRDPAQWALEQLERLRQGLQSGGERTFVLACAALLRDYLRHRLDLRFEATLNEGLRELARRAKDLDDPREVGRRLDWLLYGGGTVEPADADWSYQSVRAVIIAAERALPSRRPGTEPSAAAAALPRGAASRAPGLSQPKHRGHDGH
jgi:hypothetical protein